MTASEYHIKYYQIITAREGHFQKGCMGVSQLKEMPEYHNQKECQGEPQLKELPKNYTPISGTIKINYERNTKKFVLDVL